MLRNFMSHALSTWAACLQVWRRCVLRREGCNGNAAQPDSTYTIRIYMNTSVLEQLLWSLPCLRLDSRWQAALTVRQLLPTLVYPVESEENRLRVLSHENSERECSLQSQGGSTGYGIHCILPCTSHGSQAKGTLYRRFLFSPASSIRSLYREVRILATRRRPFVDVVPHLWRQIREAQLLW